MEVALSLVFILIYYSSRGTEQTNKILLRWLGWENILAASKVDRLIFLILFFWNPATPLLLASFLPPIGEGWATER